MARFDAEDALFVAGFVAIASVLAGALVWANVPEAYAGLGGGLMRVLIGLGAFALLVGAGITLAIERLEEE